MRPWSLLTAYAMRARGERARHCLRRPLNGSQRSTPRFAEAPRAPPPFSRPLPPALRLAALAPRHLRKACASKKLSRRALQAPLGRGGGRAAVSVVAPPVEPVAPFPPDRNCALVAAVGRPRGPFSVWRAHEALMRRRFRCGSGQAGGPLDVGDGLGGGAILVRRALRLSGSGSRVAIGLTMPPPRRRARSLLGLRRCRCLPGPPRARERRKEKRRPAAPRSPSARLRLGTSPGEERAPPPGFPPSPVVTRPTGRGVGSPRKARKPSIAQPGARWS